MINVEDKVISMNFTKCKYIFEFIELVFAGAEMRVNLIGQKIVP